MKFRHILLALTIPAAAFLASCGDDVAEKPKPTVSFQTGAGYTAANVSTYFDSTLKIGIRAFSNDKKLVAAKITLATNGGTAGTIWDTTFSNKTLNHDRLYKVAGGVGDNIALTVTVTDDNGTTASTSFTIEIIPATVAISSTSGQQVWNLIGSKPGAYDLYASGNVSAGGIEGLKDLKDMTVSTGANAGVFPKSWTSGNGGLFVKVTSNDWNNATSSDYLWQLWKTKKTTAGNTVTSIAKDDIILVKTGQAIPFNLYLIKITEIFETAVGDNNDYIKFDYKGLTK